MKYKKGDKVIVVRDRARRGTNESNYNNRYPKKGWTGIMTNCYSVWNNQQEYEIDWLSGPNAGRRFLIKEWMIDFEGVNANCKAIRIA